MYGQLRRGFFSNSDTLSRNWLAPYHLWSESYQLLPQSNERHTRIRWKIRVLLQNLELARFWLKRNCFEFCECNS